ncbi:MAG: nucleotidyltransferase domain-containing protein [Candidatus Bathyarchaeales archaeon]
MIGLPEKVRRTLEKVVKELMVREEVYGVGLFGSWSRGDAVASSDVDLLVVSSGNFEDEYVERIALNGLLIDLDFIPKRWIHSLIPPEIDQKLYEAQILYDRDWSLANAKLWITKSYSTPERVEIRTEAHIIDSDIYLSRATSALSKGDFRSTKFFAPVAMENTLKVLSEIALEPFSNSRFIEKAEASTRKLGMPHLFKEYLEMAELERLDSGVVEEKLRLLRNVWDEISFTVKQNLKTLEKAHFKVKTKLEYYFNPAFLHGALLRTNALIASKKIAEATHYLNSILLPMIENYAWLKSSMEKLKIDYTCLIASLESLEKKNPKNYQNIIKFLNLGDVEKQETKETIEKVRKHMLKIRGERKLLIKNHISKS